MNIINKAKETMSSKERVARTFNFEKTDRVTIGFDTNPIAYKNLCNSLGIKEENNLELLKALGCDYVGVGAPYVGPPLYEEIKDRTRNPEDGSVMRYIENAFGGYWDFCDFPLKNADEDTIYNYPFPDPDNYDYDAVNNQIDYLIKEGFAIHLGNPGLADILNSTGMIMSVEDTLVNLAMEDEATLHLIDKKNNKNLAVCERILEKNKDKIDFIWMGEDLGTQHTPIISLEMFRKVIRPRHQKFIDLAKSYNLPILIHTCGSSSWAYEDFIEMGITAVDTLQPEATNMSPSYLKEHFGGRLGFRGSISTAGPLAYGTAEETDKICKETLEIMMECKGYHFAPTHQIQDNTPAENIIAMYNAAHKYGIY
jgi:uroporphyrinogen decarboxylase